MSTRIVQSGYHTQIDHFYAELIDSEHMLERTDMIEYEPTATAMIVHYSQVYKTLQEDFEQSTLSSTEKERLTNKLKESASIVERFQSNLKFISQYLPIVREANAALSQSCPDSKAIASLSGRITDLLQSSQVSERIRKEALDLQGLLNPTPPPSLCSSLLSSQIEPINPFQELKGAFVSDKSDIETYSKSVKAAFAKLSREQKKILLKSIAEIMKKPALANNPMFLELDFLNWFGTAANKTAALDQLALSYSSASAATSLPVKNVPEPIVPATPPAPPANFPVLANSGLKTALREFNRVIPHINAGNVPDLKAALGIISTLNLLKCVFTLSSVQEQPIVNRLYFHLYFIHKHANKPIPSNEYDYGRKAFHEEDNFFALPIEKIRAVQRTLAEVALEGIRQACLKENRTDVRHFLDQLENNVLNLHDRIKSDQANLAHTLFGLLWDIYNPCYEKDNAHLCNPRDAAFKGDFGRVAFRDEAGAHLISKDFKLQALTKLIAELKTSWKVS